MSLGLCEAEGCPSAGWYQVRDYPHWMDQCACCHWEDRALCAEHALAARRSNGADVWGYWPPVRPL